MKMKKILSILLISVLLFGLVACGNNQEAPPPAPAPSPADSGETQGDVSEDPHVTLVFHEVNPIDSIHGQLAVVFTQRIEYLSGGSISINLQAGGVLGPDDQVLDAMIGGAGTVDMARVAAFAFNPFGARYNALLSIPFTFDGREHFWDFARSDLATEFLAETLEMGMGIRGLFYGEEGFRHFFTRDPISGIEDFAGRQLRVPVDPVMVGMVEGMGASAVVIPFTELYTALQTGVVDGAEQPITAYEMNAFPEVAPYLILNGHTVGVVKYIIAEDTWQRLTPNQQRVIMEAAAYTQDWNQQTTSQADAESLERLQAAGVTVVEVPDRQPWIDAASAVIAEHSANAPEAFQQIRAMAR